MRGITSFTSFTSFTLLGHLPSPFTLHELMIALDGVSKTFDGRPALWATSLAPGLGRTTVLLGPSGCGKSTLLRLMIGLLTPDSGSVSFDGVPLSPGNIDEARHRIGYVVQDGGVFPHLTARGNVTLLARYLGRELSWVEHRVAELGPLAHFPVDALDRFPAQLSGGERQRVALMRALMLRLPMKRFSRSDSSWMVRIRSSRVGRSSTSPCVARLVADPRIEASGVRRSCEIDVNNAARNRSVSATSRARSTSSTRFTRSIASAA